MANVTHTFPNPKLRLEATADEKTIVVALPSGREKTLLTVEENPVTGGIELSAGAYRVSRHKKRTAIYIGDSIVGNGSSADNGYRNSRSILQHAMRFLGRPVRIVGEHGFSGKRTDEIFASYDSIVAGSDPGIVFWTSGTNDFSAGHTPEQIVNNLKMVKNKVVSEGRRFVYLGMPPVSFSGGYHRLYQLLMDVGDNDTDFVFFPCGSSLLDYNATPSEIATLKKRTGLFAADGVHPTSAGAVAWGTELAHRLANYFNADRDHKITNASTLTEGDYLSNGVINGLVGASGSGFSSAVTPAGSRNIANETLNMAADGLQKYMPGRLFRTVFSPGSSPASADLMRAVVNSDLGSGAEKFASRKYITKAYVKATATAGKIRGLYLSSEFYTWGYSAINIESDNLMFDINDNTGTWPINVDSYEGVFETREYTFPATWQDPSKMHVTVRVFVIADPGATVTVDFGAVAMQEVF